MPIQTLAAKESKSQSRETKFNAIIDAAEIVFASSGFEGAKMREIAESAGVAQGLIHYHFATKEELYEQIVARRSGEINNRRTEMLNAVMQSQSPSLEAVMDALLRPTVEAGISQAENGGAFVRILAAFSSSAEDRSKTLAAKYYDEIALTFVAALMQIEPTLSRENAVWAYMFAIGAGITMMARTGRSKRLSGGLCDDGDAEGMLAKMVPFICGGIREITT